MSSDSDTARLAPTRRTVLGALGAGAGLTAFGSALGSAQSSDHWTIVVLPDTQIYAKRQSPYAGDQTQWIADNRDSENIAFVTHAGDVVDHGDVDAEWKHMDKAFSALDGTVPYSVVPGNHDWAVMADRTSSSAKYKEYFGPSRYQGRSWFGGAGPTTDNQNRENLNTYQLFSAGGHDFLHLGLEWEPPGSTDDPSTPLGWAQQVLDNNPDRPTILTTHSYLKVGGERAKSVQEKNGYGNAGQTVWEELVAPNPQVFMVVGGHWHSGNDGESHRVSTNDSGGKVYEILANYQDRTNGGYGLLQRVEFRPGGGDPDRIQVRTYSPSRDEFEKDGDSEYGFDLSFEERFGTSGGDAAGGDVDGDGDVDDDDVELVQRSVAGEDVGIDESAADVDGDGDVDIGDVVSIRDATEGGK
ncbi:metallophosphoesterase [Halopelagius longus]|uniref:Calcineurin-like phosphoesterase n=1 Tax=Halopelagius longus TaxID=1236180 RepID=A0A1H1GJQ5_9EURY|nr:metallophosphoesterase [Halopelagius longus]RDI69705.1 hypothetical protein DWB78_18210 [Halopelagius longus]SDR13313.1 Calcineurin-like phosphoesterase [Halopelagius longus]